MLFIYRPWRTTRVADHVNLTFAPCRRSGPRPIRSSSPGRLGCVPRERGRRQLRRINHLRPPFALDELPPPPSCCLFVEPSLSRSARGLNTSVPFRSVPFRSLSTRLRAYRALFEGALSPETQEALRAHTRQNKAFGNDRFRQQIETLVGRSMEVRSRGRPRAAPPGK